LLYRVYDAVCLLDASHQGLCHVTSTRYLSLASRLCDLRATHLIFWRLNFLDRALALILARPPTFHREMTTAIALPTMDQLLPSQSYQAFTGAPTLFDMHYTHQMLLLSHVIGDVWYCLYGLGFDNVHTIKENLELWYCETTKVAKYFLAHL